MTTTETRPAIDAYVVAFNETWGWVIDPADKPFIKKILTVYLLDRNERVCCCEFTPSYYQMHLYHQVICQPGTTDERAEKLYEKYEQCQGDDFYVHCHDIDGLLDSKDNLRVHHYGDTGVSYEDTERDEQMEAMREHFNCNHVL